MPDKVQQDDDLVIGLVELTLAQPQQDRETYLREACGANRELFEQVLHYVQWEHRMGAFLLDPLFPPPLEEHHFQPGELLENRFRILSEVAQGGMGIVYEAVDEKLDRRIAIKCAKSGFSQRLPPEVRHASEISHPNVCKIFEIHTAITDHGEIDFLTMEFLEGETLADLLRRGRMPHEKALLIARQVCAGLAEAHRNGVVHGDLKSNNVIVTAGPDGATRAVITDFGLARRPEASQSTLLAENEQGGTPDYMAPELWKGAKASATSDVYALGVLLYELASGHRPYPPELSWEQRQRFKPPLVVPKWDKLLARCLDPDPARRFADAEEVAQTLEPPRSRRWFLAVAAAALLAVGTGIVTYVRTATPRESVRLAVLPFESTQETAAIADKVIADAASRIARLNPGPKIRLKVTEPRETLRQNIDTPEKARSILGATHVLHGVLMRRNGKIVLQAYITDTKSLVHAKEWSAEYDLGETRYIPVALAGMVTGTFQMPALVQEAAVNAAAAKDYWAGLYYIRKNSTVNRALPLLQRAVATDGDSPLTYAALAEAEYWKFTITGDSLWLNRSAESVRQAELRNQDLAQVHRVAGLHKRQAGWYDQAAADYRRAIYLDPSNGDAYRRLGIVQEKSTQMDEALASYLRAIEVAPDDYRNHHALGAYYDNQADYNEAAIHYRRAVELAREEPSEHFVLGNVYLKLGLLKEAERELRFGINLGATPAALNDLGVVLIYQRNDSEAIYHITQALSLHPQKNAYLFWMNLGIAYRRAHKIADADRAIRLGLEDAETEIATNTRDGYVRSCLAYLCARLGQRDRARSEIIGALRQSPANTEVRFNAVLTYEELGEPQSSIKVLSASPTQVLADVSRFPDLAALHQDSRFKELLASHPVR
jgi:tetratricopeptide (TPR) repeat protein/TolB-like protein